MAQLSSNFYYFSCFPATTDFVIDVDELDNILPSWSSSTSTSMTMIFSTNQRQTTDNTWQRINLLEGPALRAGACKNAVSHPPQIFPPNNAFKYCCQPYHLPPCLKQSGPAASDIVASHFSSQVRCVFFCYTGLNGFCWIVSYIMACNTKKKKMS